MPAAVSRRLFLFGFVIQHAVAKSFKLRIFDLVAEFLAHTLVFRRPLSPARTETATELQALLDSVGDFLVRIHCYFHGVPFFAFLSAIIMLIIRFRAGDDHIISPESGVRLRSAGSSIDAAPGENLESYFSVLLLCAHRSANLKILEF